MITQWNSWELLWNLTIKPQQQGSQLHVQSADESAWWPHLTSNSYSLSEKVISALKKLQESVVEKLLTLDKYLKLMVEMTWVEWAVNCGQGEAGRKTDGVLALYCLLATVPSCVCWTSDCPQRTANKWSQSSNPTSESSYLCLCHHSYKLNDKVPLVWEKRNRSSAPSMSTEQNFQAFSLKRHIFSYETTDIHRNICYMLQHVAHQHNLRWKGNAVWLIFPLLIWVSNLQYNWYHWHSYVWLT